MENLFANGDLQDELRDELRKAPDIVNAIDADALLDRTDEEVVAELLKVREVPQLHVHWEQAWTPGVTETHLDMQHNWQYGGSGDGHPVHVPADAVEIHVPYAGERLLLRLRPSAYSLSFPAAEIGGGELVFRIAQAQLTVDQVTSAFDGFRTAVDKFATATNNDIRSHNRELEAKFGVLVADRRRRLLAQRKLSASLQIMVRPATSRPTYPLPVRRTHVHLTQPRPAKAFEPEPALDAAIYEDILNRIAAFAHAVERVPLTVGAMDEEGLRDHLLVALNTNYEGQAAGEVFSRSGKADIVVSMNDRHAFIAECKIWDGPKKFSDAVDQLLRYLVWRDTKAAIILFIKNGQPSEVITKADAALTAHARCDRRLDSADPTSRVDYLLRSTADDQRTIHTALLPFVISST